MGVGSYFHILRAQTHFWQYRGCQVLFSCFMRPDSFLAELRAKGPVFDGTEGVGSRFNVLRSLTHFRRYRGHWLSFSCFALSDTFSAVRRASGPLFIFCAPELIFQLLISCFELL
jgi:hypothetical protein